MDDRLTDSSAPEPAAEPNDSDSAPTPRLRLIIVVVGVVIVGVVVWAAAGRHHSSGTSATTNQSVAPIAPVALSAAGLATLARAVGQPIYWAGPRPGVTYELHRTGDGSVYVRYLPRGVAVGAPGAGYLTVATYKFPGAYRALQNVKDGTREPIAGGGVVLVGTTYKKSVHLAYPKSNYQVEVYDPSAAVALQIARSGRVRPAG